MMKRTAYRISQCCGLVWKDEEGKIHPQIDLPMEVQTRIKEYFDYFSWDDNKARELAQMALDDVPIPEGWLPFKEKTDEV